MCKAARRAERGPSQPRQLGQKLDQAFNF